MDVAYEVQGGSEDSRNYREYAHNQKVAADIIGTQWGNILEYLTHTGHVEGNRSRG